MLLEKTKSFFTKFRFEILALLLTAILFGSAIIPNEFFEHIVMPLCFILLAINSIILVKDQKKLIFYLFSGFAAITMCILLARIALHQHGDLQIFSLVIFIVFFAVLSFEVFRQMLREKDITHSVIIAAFDCYLLLGMMGAMLFTMILNFDPTAFTNITADDFVFDKMLYFSFITLTSIGYGDISPVSQIAEKLTALFGLIGHFYSVVIVGIIVGKYVSAKGKVI